MRRIFLYMLLAIVAGVFQQSWSQGIWQNPLPLGNDLYQVFFTNPLRGWCVGSTGVVIRTTDGGATWNIQESNAEKDLYSIYFVDDLHGWAAGDGVIVATSDGGDHWVLQTSDLNVHLQSIFFIDTMHGWTCGDGTVLRTMDGGQTWISHVPGLTVELWSVVFTNSTSGWLAGTNSLFKTIDGGQTWIDVTGHGLLPKALFYKIAFVSPQIGWLVGTKGWGIQQPNSVNLAGFIWKTTDGGDTWKVQYTDSVSFSFYYPRSYFRDLVFADPLNGFFLSVVGSYKTSDGGLNWVPAKSGPGGRYAMPHRDTMYTVGGAGTIGKSTDFATSWQRLSKGTLYDMSRVQFFDHKTGIATSTGNYPIGSVFLRTDDGGKSWVSTTTLFETRKITITSFHFMDFMRGWVSAREFYQGTRYNYNSGLVFATTDGGFTWRQQVDDSSFYSLFDIHFANSQNGLAAGTGTILRTRDGGKTWQRQFFDFWGRTEFYAAFLVDTSTAWVGGIDYLFSTNDGGRTWQKTSVLAGMQYYIIWDILFTSPLTGRIVGTDAIARSGFVLKTTDGGQSWEKVLSGYTASFNGLHFSDDQRGWVVGDGGILVSTNDGGASWDVKPLHHFRRNLRDVFFIDGKNGWVVGDVGTIIYLTGEVTAIREQPQTSPIPSQFALDQNYPNPFNAVTIIPYDLPTPAFVMLKIYNLLGQKVRTVVAEWKPAGSHQARWEGRDDSGQAVPSGIYFYLIKASGWTQIRKAVLMR